MNNANKQKTTPRIVPILADIERERERERVREIYACC